MNVASSTNMTHRSSTEDGEQENGDPPRITMKAPSRDVESPSILPPGDFTQSLSIAPISGKRPRPTILLVEDSPVTLRTYAGALSRRGYDVSTAGSVEEGRAALAARMPDIVLLDIFLPRISGFELLTELRASPRTTKLPVILISGLSDKDHIVEGLSRGANDYVTKPIVMPVLVARIEALLRTSSLIRQLETQADMLNKLAAFDELTSLYNRRALFHALETELTRTKRYQHSLSVLMIDVDHFKLINDRLGHAAGDAVLRELAQRFRDCLRVMDAVGRYGGEEFCVVLPETNLLGAIRAGERVRSVVGDQPFEIMGAPLQVTVSIGVSAYTPVPADAAPDLLAQADSALLEAKRTGRNRVIAHERPHTLV